MSKVEEFRPAVRRKRIRVALGIVCAAITLGAATLLALVAAGSRQITYTLRDGTLEVRTGSILDGSRAFAVSDVIEAKELDLTGGRRTRGTAAPGLCTGLYFYDALGPVWQATDCSSRGVVLRVRGEERPIVLSPPEPAALLQAIEARTNVTVALPPGDAWLLSVVPGAFALLLLLATGPLSLLFFVGPERMRYRVANGRLEVETALWRRAYPARELTVRPYKPGRVFRLAGTALPGYYTGLYRADGANTRFYATHLETGVLVEGPRRLFLTPEDPEGLIRALGAAGSRKG